MQAVRYAIVDGAVEEELLDFLEKANPPHCCLFSPPIQPDLVRMAPYLIEVTQEVEQWLNIRKKPWGLYFFSYNKLHLLVQHFRHYLWVYIPEQTKPVLLRFYDPRNIWTLINVLTPLELNCFIEPLTKISTKYLYKVQEDDFSSRRKVGKRKIEGSVRSRLVFTRKQYEILSRQAQNNYVQSLGLYIKEFTTTQGVSLRQNSLNYKDCAEDFFNFCQSLNVTDDKSIRGITYLLLNNGIYNSIDTPHEWISILNNNEAPIHRQVERLLLQELGFVPR